MTFLKTYSDGVDWVIALSEKDAEKVVEEHVGYEYEGDGFKKIPAWKTITICTYRGYDFDDMYAHSPILSVVREGINYPEIKTWAWVWALHEGRRFLCSTEW